MPKSNRTDFTDALTGVGVDTTGSGLPVADGIQPVMLAGDISNAAFPRRRVFATTFVVAGVAANRSVVQMFVNVPTIIRWLNLNDFGVLAGQVFIRPSGVPTTPLTEVTVFGLSSALDDSERKNKVYSGTSLPFASGGPWTPVDNTGTAAAPSSAPAAWELRDFPVPPGHVVLIQTGTVNTNLTANMCWEEQMSGL